jgi:hypothetical protein
MRGVPDGYVWVLYFVVVWHGVNFAAALLR